MDAELTSLCGSLVAQSSFDSLESLDSFEAVNTGKRKLNKRKHNLDRTDYFTKTHFPEPVESLYVGEQVKLTHVPDELTFFRTCVGYDDSISSRSSVVSGDEEVPKFETERSRVTESQVKLGNLYAKLKNAKYQSNTYYYPSGANSIETYFSDDSAEINLKSVNLNSEKFEFDNVCADVSESMNSFLAETYIKSLLGIFPYNNLSRRRKQRSSVNKRNKRRKLSASSEISSTSLA